MALEAQVYEPARREPQDRLRACAGPRGVVICAYAGPALAGVCLGIPLEQVAEVGGPDRDPRLGAGDTLYAMGTTVHPEHRRRGLGRAMKAALLEAASDLGYRAVSGRSRVGAAEAMRALNRRLGARELFELPAQYGDPAASAVYYRIELATPPLSRS